jgi:hypothetical protein
VAVETVIYVTGPDEDKLEAVAESLTISGLDEIHQLKKGMSIQDIYNEVLAADAIYMIWGGHGFQLMELSTELGFAIALGKAVYLVQSKYLEPNRFFNMAGVRIFEKADDALEALLNDLGESDEQSSVRGLGELDGLGTDSSAGGDPEPVP